MAWPVPRQMVDIHTADTRMADTHREHNQCIVVGMFLVEAHKDIVAGLDKAVPTPEQLAAGFGVCVHYDQALDSQVVAAHMADRVVHRLVPVADMAAYILAAGSAPDNMVSAQLIAVYEVVAPEISGVLRRVHDTVVPRNALISRQTGSQPIFRVALHYYARMGWHSERAFFVCRGLVQNPCIRNPQYITFSAFFNGINQCIC
ncbi:hypothetical protein KDW_20270 [Dictyobacter vulcani]|uniref:Uncharacterized protein n=1 Tax=Dictyobacter vulcani TaxID=2607529 RepID=A0A5J4KJ84_9CHLR|nr:hypothetical protein KDW_20270 [Dictyobacter vulcani]